MNQNQTDPRRTTAQPRTSSRQPYAQPQSRTQAQTRNGQPSQPRQGQTPAQSSRPAPGTQTRRQTDPAMHPAAQRQNGTGTAANPAAHRRPVRTPPKPQTAAKQEEADQPIETIIRLRGSIDRPFLILVIILVLVGSAMVFSASDA